MSDEAFVAFKSDLNPDDVGEENTRYGKFVKEAVQKAQVSIPDFSRWLLECQARWDKDPESFRHGQEETQKSDVENLLVKIRWFMPETAFPRNDRGFSMLFAKLFRDDFVYNTTAKAWYFYNGKFWQLDEENMRVARNAKTFADAMLRYAVELPEGSQKQEYIKAVAVYGNWRSRKTLVNDAQCEAFVSGSAFDANVDLFNCQNGTYNLKTGEFTAHRASDMLSKVSNVFYDPAAYSPLWGKFMNDIMEGDTDRIEYLQKILGYSLTADTHLETCWILYGATTRNGKSTLVETISYLQGNAGGYALAMQPQTLAQKQNKDTRQASGDIARLNGCRFLNASEPPKRMLFDAALLKTLLGRDSITARQLYEREFEFIPYFKLFINTNFLPLIQDDTLFTSGRINVIPFNRHFEPHEQDKNLKDKLKERDNISGIFNWCLEGLSKFRYEGAEPPESIKAATADYRKNSDKMGNFIDECLEPSTFNSQAKKIYEVYAIWCSENGYGTESKGNFFDELKSKGILAASGTVDGKTARNVVKRYVVNDEYNALSYQKARSGA
jgi:putative DNA primase/helicase